MKMKNDTKSSIISIIFIIGIFAIFYFINIYYIGLAIVCIGLGIGMLIFFLMLLAGVENGVFIFPILIIAGIGYGIMLFGDKKDGIIQDRTPPPPAKIIKIPKGY